MSPEQTCAACLAMVDTNERTGRDLLEYLGLEFGPGHGTVLATKLVSLCRLRLAMVEAEAAIAPVEHTPRVYEGGRPAGRLRQRTEELLVLATIAGHLFVCWS